MSNEQVLATKSLAEDKATFEVLEKCGFLEKLARPATESMLLIVHAPEMKFPTTISRLRDANTRGRLTASTLRAVTSTESQVRNQVATAASRLSVPLEQAAIDATMKQVTVIGLYPTLFVSLLMQRYARLIS